MHKNKMARQEQFLCRNLARDQSWIPTKYILFIILLSPRPHILTIFLEHPQPNIFFSFCLKMAYYL